MSIDARRKENKNQNLSNHQNEKKIQNRNWNYSAKDQQNGEPILQIIKRKKHQNGRSKSTVHKKPIMPHQYHSSQPKESEEYEGEAMEFSETPDESKKIEKSWKMSEFEHEAEHDSVGQDTHNIEHKEKVKVKHHHHHHHHNHVKTIVKKEPYPVEKIVHVPVEKVVHVPKPYPVEKVIEKVVHVPIEKIVHVPKPYPVEKIIEKIVHVPKPYPVEKIVEKEIEKKVEVKVPYPVEKIIHVPRPYPVEKIVEKIVHIPKPYPVFKHIHVPVEVKVPVHITKTVPYPVEKKIPYPVEVKVPYEVEKKVPYPVKVEVEKKVPYPVKVYIPQPYPVEKKEEPSKTHYHHFQTQHYSKGGSLSGGYDGISSESTINQAEFHASPSQSQSVNSHSYQHYTPQYYTSGSVHDAETGASQSHQTQLAPPNYSQPKQDIGGYNEQLPQPQALMYNANTQFSTPQFQLVQMQQMQPMIYQSSENYGS